MPEIAGREFVFTDYSTADDKCPTFHLGPKAPEWYEQTGLIIRIGVRHGQAELEFSKIDVDSQFEGRGVARAMIETAISVGRGLGIERWQVRNPSGDGATFWPRLIPHLERSHGITFSWEGSQRGYSEVLGRRLEQGFCAHHPCNSQRCELPCVRRENGHAPDPMKV